MPWDVAGLGNALVDALVVPEDDGVVEQLGLTRGTMHPVDHQTWMQAYDRIRHLQVVFDSGGSCANTIATVGLLGGRAIYCGQVGQDPMGQMYAQRMVETCGAHALRFTKDQATGKCLSIISKRDAERTMLTDLGAATELPHLGDFGHALADARIVHFTGYTLLGGPMRQSVLEALQRAADAKACISIDAADPFVVLEIKDLLWSVIDQYARLVFLNAEEARVLTDEPVEKAARTVAERADVQTVVVKLGAQGSLIYQDGKLHTVDAQPTRAVDTTGAGDAYAGGYLYGMTRGWPPDVCGKLASATASLTVSQIGAVAKDREALAQLLSEFEAAAIRAG